MVALFAGLKWRLVTSRLRRTSGAARAWSIVGFVVAIVVVGVIAWGIASARAVPEAAPRVITGLFTVQLLAWGFAPVIAFGVDETVDPQRFALLPLRPQILQRGLLVTSLVGYLPIANAVVLIGAAIALSANWSMLPVALVIVGLQLLTCVCFSRALASAMSALMSSRRGRDLGVLVGFGLIVLYGVASATLSGGGSGGALLGGATRVADVLAWTPPGGLGTFPSRLADGRFRLAAAGLAIALAGLALVWWWWGRSLTARLTTVTSETSSSAPASASGRIGGTSVGAGVIGTAGLVARRDLLMAWRDPMRRLPWLLVVFMGIFWPLLVFRGPVESGALFGVALGSLMAGAQASNQYGIEGSALWLHLVAFGDRARARGEVLGHQLAAVLPGSVAVLLALIVVAVIKGDTEQLPAAAGVCLAALLGACATASVVSARLPFAMPQSRKSLFASSVPGQKGRTAGAQLVVLGGGLVSALPAAGIAVAAVLHSAAWGWLGLLVGLITGGLLMLTASRWTAARFLESGPEIFAVVSAGDRI